MRLSEFAVAVAAIVAIVLIGLAAMWSIGHDHCLKPTTSLTDEQIDTLFQHTERGVSMSHTLRNFARAVEREHGVGVKGST